MNRWNTDKKIWAYILGIAVLVVSILNLKSILNYIHILWNAGKVLVFGAMLAYVINLIMVRIEDGLSKVLKKKKHLRPLSLLISLLIVILIFYILLTLVIPTFSEAIQVLIRVLPEYFNDLQIWLISIFENNQEITDLIGSIQINWQDLIRNIIGFLQSGISSVLGTTINIVNVVVSSVVNGVLAIIFAIYVLLEKERFVRLYHRLTNLYLTKAKKEKLTQSLKIINQTFGSFIGGQCIEATILGTLCALGMYILHMPYPLMIGTLVGVINIIPMIGAYIGGAIGMFMVFTVNPLLSLGFLVYLCILQQIESNLIYPRVVGSSVGLPGIYVMMTVVIGGSLAGISGMFLGIPAVASLYKLVRIYIQNKEIEKGLVECEK